MITRNSARPIAVRARERSAADSSSRESGDPVTSLHGAGFPLSRERRLYACRHRSAWLSTSRRRSVTRLHVATNLHQRSTPSARSSPVAFARVSSSSRSAIESATMPAPARKRIVSRSIASVRIRMLRSRSPSRFEIAERARVRAAADAFELGDDLHAAHLRAAGDRAAGKDRAHDLRPASHPARSRAAHVRHDVMHVRVALDAHQLVDLDRARNRRRGRDRCAPDRSASRVRRVPSDGRSARARARRHRRPRCAARVPAIGRVCTMSPRTSTRRSGDELAIAQSSRCRKPANGAGFASRSAAYIAAGDSVAVRTHAPFARQIDLEHIAGAKVVVDARDAVEESFAARLRRLAIPCGDCRHDRRHARRRSAASASSRSSRPCFDDEPRRHRADDRR